MLRVSWVRIRGNVSGVGLAEDLVRRPQALFFIQLVPRTLYCTAYLNKSINPSIKIQSCFKYKYLYY